MEIAQLVLHQTTYLTSPIAALSDKFSNQGIAKQAVIFNSSIQPVFAQV